MGGFTPATSDVQPPLPSGIATFLVGNGPEGICFDGTDIWVANYGDHTITQLDEYSGCILGTYAIPSGANDICYGVGSLWIPGQFTMQVTNVHIDGSIASLFPADVLSGMSEIVFDGTNLWTCGVGINASGIVTKYDTSGNELGSCTIVVSPTNSIYCVGLYYDGATSIWVTDSLGHNLSQIDMGSCTVIHQYALGPAFDGSHYGVYGDGTYLYCTTQSTAVYKVLASTGAIASAFTIPSGRSLGCYVNGTNLFVSDEDGAQVFQLSATDGSLLGTFPVGPTPWNMCMANGHLWVINFGSQSVSRIVF